jgi:hypothetical protein
MQAPFIRGFVAFFSPLRSLSDASAIAKPFFHPAYRSRPFNLFLALLLILGARASLVEAKEDHWSLGVTAQDYVDLQPGQDWVLGGRLGYSNYNLFHHRLEFMGMWETSRLEALFRENIYRQDYYLAGAEWHFRRTSLFDPTVKAITGLHHYDIEFPRLFGDLNNNTWVAGAGLGLNLNFKNGSWGVQGAFDYLHAFEASSLVFPLNLSFILWKTL